jgi:hypothetical protein
MKRLLALLSLTLLPGLIVTQAQAASHLTTSSHPFGLGIVLGEPTGLSAKYWVTSHHAVDFGLAYSFNSFVYIFADYLFHFPGAFGTSSRFVTQLNPYIGIGGIFLGSTSSGRVDNKYFTSGGSSAGVGLRLPLGIEWSPGEPPLGIFVELVPGIGIIPSTFGFLEGGIGVRYYF